MSSDTDRYGPQTEQIEDLFARLEVATFEQLQLLADAYVYADASAAYDAACNAAYDAAYVYAYNAACNAAPYAAYAAAYALAVRHLISEDGFTWEHYRTLTEPVASVLGALHPED